MNRQELIQKGKELTEILKEWPNVEKTGKALITFYSGYKKTGKLALNEDNINPQTLFDFEHVAEVVANDGDLTLIVNKLDELILLSLERNYHHIFNDIATYKNTIINFQIRKLSQLNDKNIGSLQTKEELFRGFVKKINAVENLDDAACLYREFNENAENQIHEKKQESNKGNYKDLLKDYALYNQAISNCTRFCTEVGMQTKYSANASAIKKAHNDVKEILSNEKNMLLKKLSDGFKQHLEKIAVSPYNLLDTIPKSFNAFAKKEIEISAKSCQQSYLTQVVNNPACSKTAEDSKIIQAGRVVFNVFVILTGISLLSTAATFLYNKVKKTNQPVNTLIKPLSSDTNKLSKQDAKTFLQFFDTKKPTESKNEKSSITNTILKI